MNKLPRLMVLAASAMLAGCAVAQSPFSSFPDSADPRVVGKRVAENLLERKFRVGPSGYIQYPEICTTFGALQFAAATGDKDLEQKLIARYDPVWLPENSKLIPPPGHVDNNVFGVLPLQIFRNNGDPHRLALGLKLADLQWENPLPEGVTRQTRWWVDDGWMVGSLQIQAFRATRDPKYADRAAAQLAAFLDKLQRPDGLFYHGPKAPFYWARGNGWVAAALAEVLQSLPPSHPKYDRIMAGYKKMMAGLKACQAPSGLWHQLLDDPASFEETSGTGMYTYAMIVGVKRGWLGADYADNARRGWLALCDKMDEKFNLTQICVGTNQSDSKQFYLERPRQTGDLHGQAPVLWCAWALLERKEDS